MDKYSIGLRVDGIEHLDIEDERLLDMKNCLVAIILTEDSNGKLYNYYSATKRIILNGNKVILLIVGTESRIRKQLSMLLMSYRHYDIYSVEDKSSISRTYIDSLAEREPSETEVSTFINSDITAYAEINDILLRVIKSINESDIDDLRAVIENSRDSIEDFVEVIDYMKTVIDTVNIGESEKKAEELNNKVASLQELVDEANRKVKNAEREVEIAKEDKELLQREAFQAKQRNAELEERLNSREPVIRTYSEVQTQMIRCKVPVIIYFKEISHISYIASMITQLMVAMSKMKKLKVKLMIYDNKHSFLSAYKPIPIVGSSEFVSNRDNIVTKHDKIVVVEANQALIEEVLVNDWDVVIIYDRLKQANDIVSGNNVYKYWVLNSMNEYETLHQAFKIDSKNIITRPGILPESITISEVREYKTHTPSAKLSDYVNMINTGENHSKVFDMIFTRTNVNTLPGRGRE